MAGATCDKARNVCVLATSATTSTSTTSSGSSSGGSSSSSSSSGSPCDVDGGIDGGGCYACDAGDNILLLNHCTPDGCTAFDNSRVKALGADGTLPGLPMPGPDGGM
jgi:hypothetical protein